jgi:lysophospholipase L1-like esterase
MVPLKKFLRGPPSAVTTPIRRASLPAIFLVLALTAAVVAHAAPPAPDHWVGTWATAPMAANNGPNSARVAAAPAVAPPSNSATPVPPSTQTPSPTTPPAMPAAAPSGRPPAYIYGIDDVTLREIVHVSIGGPKVRVIFTNEFGTDPLTIGSAHIAVSQGASAINLVAASSAGLTFGGRTSVTVPPGALIVSDPAAVNVPAESDLAVSFFLPAQPIHQLSQHGGADQTSYRTPGNAVGAKTFDAPAELRSWVFLKGVDVTTSARGSAVVAFGDSITDGAFAAVNQNARWPDELARRLVADKRTADISVLNEGIGGNRILHDNAGPSALARFDRDVIAQAGVKYVIILEAINDIGHAFTTVRPYDVVSTDDLLTGYKQMAERAHMHGIKVYFATLTPYTGAGYMSPAGEEVRVALNTWIRTTRDIDGFIDFDKATADPAHPDTFLPAYDHGDHLHPSDPGYKAMGDAIDLTLFTK